MKLAYVKIGFLILFSIVILQCIKITYASTETFTVPPLQEITRILELKEGEIVSGSITVSGGSGNDINFYVTNPKGDIILRYDRTTDVDFSFTATISGTYIMHFDNSFSIISSKTITLSYSIKTSILGVPQDVFLLFLVLVIALIAIVSIIVVLRRSKK